jgi:hypothetical protein
MDSAVCPGRAEKEPNNCFPSDWTCSPMVERSSGTLPTRVQILVLAPFPGFISRFSGVMR